MTASKKFLFNLICFFAFIFFLTGSVDASSQNLIKDLNHSYTSYVNSDVRPAIHSAGYFKADSILSMHSDKNYFFSLLEDFKEQGTSPFRMKTKQWLLTGAAAGITVMLIHYDDKIDHWARVQKQEHGWVRKTSPVITRFGGDVGVYSVIATAMVSAAARNEKGFQTSLLATRAMITSGVWVNIIKILTGRERPLANYTFSQIDGGKWYGPLAKYDQDASSHKPVSAFDAFPSGHTATAFSIATVFALQYKDKKAVPIICYTAASLVGVSRLVEHQHWASDVFVGALAGYFCGRQVVSHYNRIYSNSENVFVSKSKIKPELTFIQLGNQVGLALSW